MPDHQSTMIAIAVLAVMTYITRIIGYILGQRIQEGSRTYRIIQTLPGCALCAVVAPVFVHGSPLEMLTIGVSSLFFYRTGQILPALLLALVLLIAGNHLLVHWQQTPGL